MHSRWAHLAMAGALTVAIASTGMVFGATSANAAEPVIIGSCATTIQGAPGTPIELSPAAVVTPVTNLLDAIPILGPTLAAPFQSAFNALPPIPIGAISTGTTTITGGQVANAVNAQLAKIPLLGPVISTLSTSVQSTLTSLCGVTVTGINTAAEGAQNGTAAVASGSQQVQQDLGLAPKSTGTGTSGAGSGGSSTQTGAGSGGGSSGASASGGGDPSLVTASNSPVVGGLPADYSDVSWPFALLGIGTAESPLQRYAGIPFASAGLFSPSPGVRYGGEVSGYTPGYGVLDNNANSDNDGIQTAGNAEALGGNGLGTGTGGIGLPMLLAVLALSGVTAALVRTWVLRRVPIA